MLTGLHIVYEKNQHTNPFTHKHTDRSTCSHAAACLRAAESCRVCAHLCVSACARVRVLNVRKRTYGGGDDVERVQGNTNCNNS